MVFRKSDYKGPKSKTSNNQTEKILETVVNKIVDENEIAKKALEKIDESQIRYLSQALTYYYYLLSIAAACIGFTISLTINEKFKWFDFFIIISLILWIISFFFGMRSVTRTNQMMLNFTYYLLGETNKFKEIIDTHKPILDELVDESTNTKRQPLIYLLVGLFFFAIWYTLKIIVN